MSFATASATDQSVRNAGSFTASAPRQIEWTLSGLPTHDHHPQEVSDLIGPTSPETGIPTWAFPVRRSLSAESRARHVAAVQRRNRPQSSSEQRNTPRSDGTGIAYASADEEGEPPASNSPTDYHFSHGLTQGIAARASETDNSQLQDWVERWKADRPHYLDESDDEVLERPRELLSAYPRSPTDYGLFGQQLSHSQYGDFTPATDSPQELPVEGVVIPSEREDDTNDASLEARSLSASDLAEHTALGAHRERERNAETWRFIAYLAQRFIPSRPSSAHESYMTSRDILGPPTHAAAVAQPPAPTHNLGDDDQDPMPEALEALEIASQSSQDTDDSDWDRLDSQSTHSSEEWDSADEDYDDQMYIDD